MNIRKHLFIICSTLLLCGCSNINVAHDNSISAVNASAHLNEIENIHKSTTNNRTTADSNFINLPFIDVNDNKAKDKWNAINSGSNNPYEFSNFQVITQGLKLSTADNVWVQTTVTVDENYSTVKIDIRRFGTESYLNLKVNDNIVTPVRVNGDASIASDGKITVVESWSTIKYDLTNYIGQTVTIKLVTLSKEDSAVGGFYFTNTKFSTSSENAFIGETNNDDGTARNAWINYSSNQTGAYEYYRNTFTYDVSDPTIGNEGLKFHVNRKDYLIINDVLVDPIAPKWSIDIRGFVNGTYIMEVDGNKVTPTIKSGVATLDGSTINANSGWSVVYYDLTNYSEKRVTVKLSITNGGDSMIGGFYFDSADEYRVKAIQYARDFNTDIQDGICKPDGSTNENDLKTAWSNFSERYNNDLSDDSKNLLNGTTTLTFTCTDIQSFQRNYDEILRLRGASWELDNFMNRTTTSSINVFNKLVANNNNNVALVVVITLVAVSLAIAIPYFAKRRKQQD